MQKFKIFLIILIMLLASSLAALAGFDKDDIYSPPSMPECSITSLQLIAQNGDCLLFEGEAIFVAAYSALYGIVSDSGFWFRSSFISQTNFGSVAGIMKIDNITKNIENRNYLNNSLNSPTITEAYMSFNISKNSFIKVGFIPNSITSLRYNTTENYLGLTSGDFNISVGKEYLLDCSYSYFNFTCRPPYTDYAVQLFSNIGNGIDAAIALEDLAGRGVIVGVINYTDDNLEGHFSILADEIFSTNNVIWRFHAGASISADISDEITIKLGTIWHEHNISTSYSEQWQIATGLEAKFTESLTFTGEVGIVGETGFPITIAYGSAELKWELKDNFKASIKARGNDSGAYNFTFLTSKKFN